MITGIVGLPGHGKSLWLVHDLLEAHRGGRRCIANFHSRFDAWEFMLWESMLEADNALVGIDEAHMWFGSRSWQKNTQHELAYFQQSRKEGLDLVWVAQHSARVDVAIRELTSYMWKVRKIGNFLVGRQYTDDEPRETLGRRVRRIDPRAFKAYFSEERIGTRDGQGYGFGRSAALARPEGRSGQVAERVATHVRLEGPNGEVQFLRLANVDLAHRVYRLMDAYRLLEVPFNRERAVVPFATDEAGRPGPLDAPAAVPSSLIEQIEQLLKERGLQ